ncbi:MAG TPA: glycosyltransferase [Vicinamibacterales bacterium]
MRRPVIGHVFGRFLPLSEVFSYELLRSLEGRVEQHVIASRLEHQDRFPWPRVHLPGSARDAWTLARELGVELAVGHFGPTGTTVMPLALANRIPAATIFHGYDVSMLLRDPVWVERYRGLADLGLHAICISEAGRRRLRAIGWPARQIDVIHLGVDTARIAITPGRPRLAHEPLRLLMVARLVPKKGVDVAVRAMAALKASGVTATLTVIGEGPEHAALRDLTRALGLGAVVVFAGARRHDEVLEAMASADVLLQCSVTAPDGDQEGIPVSLMEAQARGVPVVATRHSGIPELVVHGRTGLLVDEHDAEGLASAVQKLAADPALARRLAAAGRRRVERHFDRARQAERFTRVFTRLIAEGAPVRRRTARRAGPRILFVRTVPVDLTFRRLMALRGRYGGAHVTVLTTESSAAVFRNSSLADAVVTYPDGRLGLSHLGRARLAALQAARYDLVAVAYPDEQGRRFGNVRRVARALGGSRRVALTVRDAEVEIPGIPRPDLLRHPAALERTA